MLVVALVHVGASQAAEDWPQWRGPESDGAVRLAASLGKTPFHLEIDWSRPLGSGYSAVAVQGGQLFTLYGDEDSDLLVALDTETGAERWRYRIGDAFAARGGSAGGPASMPAVADGMVYGLGPRGKLFAVRARDGGEVWAFDLVQALAAKPPFYGFATSPMVVGNLLFVQAGGSTGGSLVAVDRRTGELRWKQGNDAVAYQSPAPATLGGVEQIVAVTEERLVGLDPTSGAELWSVVHDVSGREGASTAVPIHGDRILLAGSRQVALYGVNRRAETWAVSELWRNRELRGSFSTPVVHGEQVYGFMEEFLTCLRLADGARRWRSRPPGGQSLILVGNQLVIGAADGALVVADAVPDAYRERARIDVFAGETYTPPSFGAGAIFVRDTRQLAAVRVQPGAAPATAREREVARKSRFMSFVRSVEQADDKSKRIDAFLDQHDSFPIVEDERLVHFVYRGEAEDLAVAGSMIEVHDNAPMRRIDGTDFFYRTFPIEPGARWEYQFIVDFEHARPDPRNPRRARIGGDRISELVLPGWEGARHTQPYRGRRVGRLEEFRLKSEILGSEHTVTVYLPHGYDRDAARDYPLVILNDGAAWLGPGALPNTLNHLIEQPVRPVIAAFVEIDSGAIPDCFGGVRSDDYVRMLAEELIPAVDGRYHTSPAAAWRTVVGAGLAGLISVHAAIERPDVFGNAGALSAQLIEPLGTRLLQRIETTAPRARVHVAWNRYELRSAPADFDLGRDSRRLFRTLDTAGFAVRGGELMDASGWGSWSAHVADILRTQFPTTPVEESERTIIRE